MATKVAIGSRLEDGHTIGVVWQLKLDWRGHWRTSQTLAVADTKHPYGATSAAEADAAELARRNGWEPVKLNGVDLSGENPSLLGPLES